MPPFGRPVILATVVQRRIVYHCYTGLLLLYPSSSVLIINEVLSLLGTIEILPMETPLTVLAWSKVPRTSSTSVYSLAFFSWREAPTAATPSGYSCVITTSLRLTTAYGCRNILTATWFSDKTDQQGSLFDAWSLSEMPQSARAGW